MATITLEYEVPQNRLKLADQQDALRTVSLETTGPNNELLMLGGISESAPRVVTPSSGPPPILTLTVTYATTADFLAYFPTAQTQIAAVANLWTQRISLQLATRCTALTPVITP